MLDAVTTHESSMHDDILKHFLCSLICKGRAERLSPNERNESTTKLELKLKLINPLTQCSIVGLLLGSRRSWLFLVVIAVGSQSMVH